MTHPTDALLTVAAQIPDYRERHNKRHVLSEIVVMAVCAMLCGANTFTEIAQVATGKRTWFATFLTLPGGIPSHDTFNRVLARIHPAALEQCFHQWMRIVCEGHDIERIAVDGKELHHSQNPQTDQSNLRTVNVWAIEYGLALAQLGVDDESNEIPTVRRVLELIDIEGCDISADAMHCQRETADTIIEQGGAYTLTLKGHQGTLYRDLMTLWATRDEGDPTVQLIEHIEKGHGRIETRSYRVTNEIAGITTQAEWHGLQSVGIVDSERRIGTTVEREQRYFIMSYPADVARFARNVREHWHIENRLHWRLDVIMGEDDAHLRVGHAAENMAIVRKIALNMLTQERSIKAGTQAKRLRAACDNTYLEQIIAFEIRRVDAKP